ncbi:MAG: ABC transporter permease, partial [Clostridia bacterium]|nr:ABC transporter permease [Clostridia bacterium]
RKREKTKEIVTPKYTEDVKLINSKMKYKSSAELGVKSLLVKPGRLVFTIILSVIAFAVFGLFDTVAAYQDTRAIQNLLKKSDYSAISLYSEYSPESHYYVNTDVSSRNTVKFTDADVLKLSQESGYKFRPVYDLDDSKLTMVNSVKKIENVHVGSSMATSIGALYYIPQVSGYVEFKNDELGVTEEGIVETIDQGGFNLKLVAGNFPTFVVDPVSGEANVKEIAISEYLAKSICYWNGGNSDPALMDVNLLIDTEIKVGNEFFIIKGVYNSGEIHKKYDSLKEIPLMASSLADEFETYLHAGLYFNILVPEGYIEHKMAQNGRVGGYFNLKKTYDFTFSDTSTNYTKSGSNRFYNVGDIDSSKIYMFEEERNENIELADDEVLINLENLDDIYLYEKDRAGQYLGANISKEMTELEVDLLRRNSMTMTDEMKADLKAYIGLVDRLARDYPNVVSSYIKTVDFVIFEDLLREDMRQYKIVGVYTGVDTDINKVNAVTIHPFAMTKNGLDGLKINPNQGVYGRIIAPMNTSNRATKYLSKKMTSGGIVLAWFGNNVLEIITENGEMIMQFAQLFLYVAIVLALFSVFMLYNYISASIVSKKQSIGVLRALGSGSKDIFLMFITESLIIAFINGVLASGVAALGCIFVNMYIKNVMNLTINFAIYGIRQVIIIMIASVFTAVVSSLLPIIKISKEKPVNLIREP